MLLEYFPIQSVVCYHDIADTWPWSLQLTLSSRMSQVHTALDHQAGSYINGIRTMSQFRCSSHWTLTLSHWPANMRRDWHWWKKEWDARNPNYHDGLQCLICVVIGFGGYCEIIRGLYLKKTAPYKNFLRPLSVIYHFKKFTSTVVFWTGWHQVHNCRNFKTNLLWEDQTKVHSCFLWLGKKKNSVWVKHPADLPEGQLAQIPI